MIGKWVIGTSIRSLFSMSLRLPKRDFGQTLLPTRVACSMITHGLFCSVNRVTSSMLKVLCISSYSSRLFNNVVASTEFMFESTMSSVLVEYAMEEYGAFVTIFWATKTSDQICPQGKHIYKRPAESVRFCRFSFCRF